MQPSQINQSDEKQVPSTLFQSNLFAKGLTTLPAGGQQNAGAAAAQMDPAIASSTSAPGALKPSGLFGAMPGVSGLGSTVPKEQPKPQIGGSTAPQNQATSHAQPSLFQGEQTATGSQGLFSKPIFAPKGLGSLPKPSEVKPSPVDHLDSAQLTNVQQVANLMDQDKIQQHQGTKVSGNATKDELKDQVDSAILSASGTPLTTPQAIPVSQLESKDSVGGLPAGLIGKSFASLGSVQGGSGPGLFGSLANPTLMPLSQQIGGNAGSSLGLFNAGQSPALGGQLVLGTNHLYQSLDLIAPSVSQDLDLSVDRVDGSKAKLFVLTQSAGGNHYSSDSDDASGSSRRSALVFLTQKGQNLSILLDQQELSENVIGDAVQKEFQIGEILDFTLVERQSPDYLYLICLVESGKLLIFDCKSLLVSQAAGLPHDDVQVRYLNTIELNDSDATRLQAAELSSHSRGYQNLQDDECQVLVASSHKLTLVTVGMYDTEQQTILDAPDSEVGCPIQDLFWRNTQLFVCYQSKQKGSTIVVYDVESLQVLFRAGYADCDKVQNLYYVAPLDDSSQALSGHLVLSELKQKKFLKKIHIVQINQRFKSKKRVDKLEQIDALTFSDDSAKLLTVVQHQHTFFLFMINRERITKQNAQPKVRLFSVKMGYKSSAQEDASHQQLAFHFVTEVMGKVDHFQQSKDQTKSKPTYLCAYYAAKSKRFYLYAGVGQSCAVFSRSLQEVGDVAVPLITPRSQEEHSTPNKGNSEVDDFLKKIDEEKVRDQLELDAQLNEQVRKNWEEIEGAPSSLSRQSDNEAGHDPAIQSSTTKKVKQPKPNSLYPQQQQQQQAQQQAKKQKDAKKDPKQQTPPSSSNQEKTPPQPQAQSSQDKPKQANPQPTKQAQQQAQQAQVVKKAIPAQRKGQQDLLIENYQELNKKYADLHIKLNQLHQQVQSQRDIQVQVEMTITKAIRNALPELVKKQVEETLPPILANQADMLDRQVRQVLIPRLEQIFTEPNQEHHNVKAIVKSEFQEALKEDILPELEKQMKQMLGQVRENLMRVDDELFKKLVNEEHRSDQMVQLLEQKLQQQLQNQIYQQQQVRSNTQQFQQQQTLLQPQFQQQIGSTQPTQQVFQPLQQTQQQPLQQMQQPLLQPAQSFQLVSQPSLQSQQKLERQTSLQIQQQPFTPSQTFVHQPQQQQQLTYQQQQFTPTTQQQHSTFSNSAGGSQGPQRFESQTQQQQFFTSEVQQQQLFTQQQQQQLQSLGQAFISQKIAESPEFTPQQFVNQSTQPQQQQVLQPPQPAHSQLNQSMQHVASQQRMTQSPMNNSMHSVAAVSRQSNQQFIQVQPQLMNFVDSRSQQEWPQSDLEQE